MPTARRHKTTTSSGAKVPVKKRKHQAAPEQLPATSPTESTVASTTQEPVNNPQPELATTNNLGPAVSARPESVKADSQLLPPVQTPPLTKTAYNRAWLRAIMLVTGAAAIGGMAFGGWWWYQRTADTNGFRGGLEPYQLQLPAEPLDESRAASIAADLRPSIPASASDGATITPHYVAEFSQYSTPELYAMLIERVQQLKGQGIDISTLQTYEPEARNAESTNPERARDLLMEGLQLARELQALHEYYGE